MKTITNQHELTPTPDRPKEEKKRDKQRNGAAQPASVALAKEGRGKKATPAKKRPTPAKVANTKPAKASVEPVAQTQAAPVELVPLETAAGAKTPREAKNTPEPSVG